MKSILAKMLIVVGLGLSAVSFSGSIINPGTDSCPLQGTPLCPAYSECCP